MMAMAVNISILSTREGLVTTTKGIDTGKIDSSSKRQIQKQINTPENTLKWVSVTDLALLITNDKVEISRSARATDQLKIYRVCHWSDENPSNSGYP